MSEAKTIRAAWVGAQVLVALAMLALWAVSREPITTREVDNLIRTQLPLESNKKAVIRLAIAQGWLCSDYMGPNAPERKVPLFSDYHAPGLVYAQTAAWHEWIINYCYIDIFFLFDKHGKLTGCSALKGVEGM